MTTVTLTEERRASTAGLTPDDARLVGALRRGEEAAFVGLVDRYQASLVAVAMIYVRNRSVAEEVVQETWLSVLQGIGRFEGRSSLKTWIFRILTNRAKTRARREGRSIPFSALGSSHEDQGPAVSPDRFVEQEGSPWLGHWSSPPTSWDPLPEERLLSKETLGFVESAIRALPQAQRLVVTLRDVEGWTAQQVCELLHLSDVNQRVLLHRARSRVRAALERHLLAE